MADEILSRDQNKRTVAGGLNSTDEIRQLRLTDEGYLIIGSGGGASGHPTVTLTGRLLNKWPQDGYRLWFDTADTSFIYIGEAPAASTSASTTFNILRIPIDADCNLVGEAETVTGVAWDDRTTTGGWT